MWTTTLQEDLQPLDRWVNVPSDLAQDRRAWGASIRDVVNSISDVGHKYKLVCFTPERCGIPFHTA